MTTRKKAQIIN